MHEDEESEPENGFEILEKKRQRAIEVCECDFFICNLMCQCFPSLTILSWQEWRAQQIASGEAKDNANFQPLGGDWYWILKPTLTIPFSTLLYGHFFKEVVLL